MEEKNETKETIYYAIVKSVKEFGQGIPKELFKEELIELADELVKEGRLKYVTMPYSYLPDSNYICLAKGYCVEDERKNFQSSLASIRYYLGQKELFGCLFPNEDHRKAFEADEGNMKRYNKWLLKNKEQLDELNSIEYDNKYETVKL
jgi:hypothetical protein